MNNSNVIIQEPPSDFGIRLLEKEEVIFSLRPCSGFIIYWSLGGIILSVLGGILGGGILLFAQQNQWIGSLLIVGAVVVIIISLVLASLAKQRYHYWLTNKRVIWSHGLIGYQVRSVPLERIADVMISRTLVEQIIGISSIIVRDMAGGQGGYQGYSDYGVRWIAVPNVFEVQQRILEEVKKVNERIGRL